MMKKLLTFIMTSVLCVSMGMTALAAGGGGADR